MTETKECKQVVRGQKKQEKYEHFCRDLKGKGRVMVALSGGVDSSLVAASAYRVLGEQNSLAVTIDSEVFPRWEREMATRVTKKLGMRHVIKRVSLLTGTVKKNTPQRCYQCKKMMADVLWDVAHQEHLDTIADGITTDDLANDSYVGVKAWTDRGIWHPLAQYGFTHAEIRLLAREQGLENWDKPPEACLATRLAPYETITPKKLDVIQEAEAFLHPYVSRVRVRMHQDLARIQVAPRDIQKIVDMKKKVIKKLRDLGVRYVTLDLTGYPGWDK